LLQEHKKIKQKKQVGVKLSDFKYILEGEDACLMGLKAL